MSTRLSLRELNILRLLAVGKTYEHIRDRLNAALVHKGKRPSVTPENIHATCWSIRKKTGIKNTRDAHECHLAIHGTHSRVQTPCRERPTSRQLQVLRLIVQGVPYATIAAQMGLSSAQTAQNYASEGCKRIRIDVPAWQRTHAIKLWLEKHDAPSNPKRDPMDDPAF